MRNEIEEKFGGHLRVRVLGILVQNQKMLMVRHQGLTAKGYLWSPPGGGADFQISLVDNLKREFLEETGLQIDVHQFMFVNEFYTSPLHAIELFFKVVHTGGRVIRGTDPELTEEHQIIEEVRYFGLDDFRAEDGPQMHSAFRNLHNLEELLNMRGYFQNWK